MPTIITHGIVGLAGGKSFIPEGKASVPFWVLSVLCPILPDVDVAGFSLGISYGTEFGHRGITHSFFFAAIIGALAAIIVYRAEDGKRLGYVKWTAYFFLLTATHGILDAFTDGGMGVAFFAPFNETRYFLPWRPIRVAPIALSRFFSRGTIPLLLSEALLVWVPAGAFVLFRLRKKKEVVR
jgi:inner membrane protein